MPDFINMYLHARPGRVFHISESSHVLRALGSAGVCIGMGYWAYRLWPYIEPNFWSWLEFAFPIAVSLVTLYFFVVHLMMLYVTSGGYMSVSDDGMWLLPYGKRVIGWSEISTIRAKKYYHRGMYMGTNLCVDFVCPDDFVEKNVFGSRFGSKGWARANRFLGGADFEMDFGTFEASREEIMAAIHSSSNGQFGEPATTSAQADI